MISVKFTRKPTDLHLSAVYVAGERLRFQDNVAFKLLERGAEEDIHWRILGATGGKLVMTKTVDGVEEDIVESEIRPQDEGRVSDFTLFIV